MSARPVPGDPQQDWKQWSVDALFVAAEAVAWYVVLRIGATAVEQARLGQMAERLRLTVSAAEVADGTRAADALRIIERAAHVEHGPGILVVLATAFGGFLLMRGLQRWRVEGALGAITLIGASVLALNVLMHIALVGDLRLWDPSSLAGSLGDANDLSSRPLVEAFVRRPTIGGPSASTVTFIFGASVVLWVRFVIAGRSRVTFERVLRSFTVGFVVTVVGIAVAAMEGIAGVQLFAVPQFVLGMLALAVANNARTSVPVEGARRTGPWLASVGGTVLVLLVVALMLGALAFLNVGVALRVIGDLAWAVIAFLLIVIITPIYWVLERVVRWLLPNGIVQWPELPNLQLLPPDQDAAEQASRWAVPLWAQNGLRFLAVAVIVYVVCRVAMRLMRRSRSIVSTVDEVRGRASAGVGIGGLLRGLLPGAARRQGEDWLRLHAIYRLFARAARGAEDRGFRYLPGETPIEFGRRADRAMSAPPYPAIALAFDRARYGRHFPEDGQVRSMESALASWEAATPPTEELRHRLAGAAPLDEAQEFLLHVVARRQIVQGAAPEPGEDVERFRQPPI